MRRQASAAAALALAGCVSAGSFQPSMPLSALPGWAAEDHAAALALVRETCVSAHDRSPTCAAALGLGDVGEAGSRRFLEANYRARPIEAEGVLTAYYAPTFEARRAPLGDFTAPVRPGPAPWAAGLDRATIDEAPAPDALAWMRPEDVFALQTQGSGRLEFPDGARRRALFAGANGLAFAEIGRPMVERGFVAPGEASADRIQAWLAANRGPGADALMRLDPRYVFFRLAPDDGSPVRGAAGAALVAGRSLAVDPAEHPWFELLWIDADRPALAGARPAYRRLAVATDKGAAIRGPARADLYLGEGQAAGDEAAHVRHRLKLWRIAPAAEAAR